MALEIQKLFEALPPEGSIDELGLIIDAIRDIYALENVSYLAVSLGREFALQSTERAGALKKNAGFWWRKASMLVASTYNPDWGHRYEEANYVRIDPVVEGGHVNFVPMNWKDLNWDSRPRRQFLQEAVDYGIGNQGYTVPVRGPNGQYALFTINNRCPDDEWRRFLSEKATDFLIIAHFFHQKVIEIEKVFGEATPVHLSSRERDVLTYISLGKNRAQAAHELKISENTLRVYLDSARHKLGALNIPHAVALSVSRGFISI